MANEIQRVYWGFEATPFATSDLEDGTFTITYDGETTGTLNYNDSAATIQAALEALSNIGVGNVAVAATLNGFTITFQGTLANTNVNPVTVSQSLKVRADTITISVQQSGLADTPTNPSNSTTTAAVSPVDEVQVLSLGGATTGTFNLDCSGYSSQIVNILDQTGIQTACDNMFGFGNATVTSGGDYTITFGGSLAATPMPLMTVSNNTTDGNPSVSPQTDGVAGVHQVDTCNRCCYKWQLDL